MMTLNNWLKSNVDVFREGDMQFIVRSLFAEELDSLRQNESLLNYQMLEALSTVKEFYLKGVPLAYILGKDEFFGREFKVPPWVLVPRKETELIAEKAIEIAAAHSLRHILDLGCGCGNIAITINKALGDEAVVVASDVSEKALATTRSNADYHRANIRLQSSDLFEGFSKNSFDLIISNPPYVETRSIRYSLKIEPRIALNGGEDGLFLVAKILNQAYQYLRQDGYLIIEIGYDQQPQVAELIKRIGTYEIIEWIKDYSQIWRGVVLRNKWINS